MELLKAYQEMIKVHGTVGTAATLGVTKAALEARVYELKGSLGLHVRTAMLIQEYSGTKHFAEAVAAQSGGVFMELPGDDLDGEAIDESMLLMCEQLGDLARTYREAKKDGEIDRKERSDLSHKANDLHATLKKSLFSMFKVYCKES